MATILIVGSGAREHAFAWKLRQSPAVDRVYVAPGNAGTARDAENVPIAATDIPSLVRFVREQDVMLTVVGPEAPLALGLADALRADGRLVVGPGAAAARIESSKSFAKDLMRRTGVPTAAFKVFDRAGDALRYLSRAAYPLVIKADGLAAGKGVVVCEDAAEARASVEACMIRRIHGAAGDRIVVESCLSGPEISLLALVDGRRVVSLPIAQDHKRLGDGDTGPNTGGMGAYAPVPVVTDDEREALVSQVMQPVVDALAEQATPYRGILFAGLMLTADGPRVLEFNCRCGDPETQVILPLVADDLYPWLLMAAGGRLHGGLQTLRGSAVGVVLAAPGYPDAPILGSAIHDLDQLPQGVMAFHAGTSVARGGAGTAEAGPYGEARMRRTKAGMADGAGAAETGPYGEEWRIVTAGGRVLTIVGTGRTIDEAAERAYSAPVSFDGMQRRTDIGWQARHTLTPRPPLPQGARGRYIGSSPLPREGEGSGERGGPRIAVFASGDGSNLQALIDARDAGTLEADIALVVSHDPAAHALGRARAAGIPTAVHPLNDRKNLDQRQRFEIELLALIAPYKVDLIVLAGWMLILSHEFLARCGCPVINIHPALLDADDIPRIRGAHAVRDALTLGLPYTGVTIHHVTPEVDAGPAVLSEVVEILPGDDEQILYSRIKPVEHRLIVEAVQSLLLIRHAGGVYA